jgi:hypothetical protein
MSSVHAFQELSARDRLMIILTKLLCQFCFQHSMTKVRGGREGTSMPGVWLYNFPQQYAPRDVLTLRRWMVIWAEGMSGLNQWNITMLCRQMLELKVEQSTHLVQALYNWGETVTIIQQGCVAEGWAEASRAYSGIKGTVSRAGLCFYNINGKACRKSSYKINRIT